MLEVQAALDTLAAALVRSRGAGWTRRADDPEWLVRGGLNTPDRWESGAELIDAPGALWGVSTRMFPGTSIPELVAGGRPGLGLRNARVSISTVDVVVATGRGRVEPDWKPANPYHTFVGGLTAKEFTAVFIEMPNWWR